eukprot:3376055-Rhodomonas_salina.1
MGVEPGAARTRCLLSCDNVCCGGACTLPPFQYSSVPGLRASAFCFCESLNVRSETLQCFSGYRHMVRRVRNARSCDRVDSWVQTLVAMGFERAVFESRPW